jgi:diguanylate cyclase (GGDEF)-like protein
MSTTQFTNVTTFPLAPKQDALPGVYDTPTAIRQNADLNHLLHQFAQQLQSSLEIEEILGQFSREIKPFVPHDYLSYNDPQKSYAVSLGENARHRLSFQLDIQGEDVGQVLVSRKRGFSKTETETLDKLIRALLYPLRNALMYQQAVRAAQKDALTGTGNRAALNKSLKREIETAQRHKRALGMIIFDIDHFKNINDTYGHNSGDCLLKALTETAEDTIRVSDQLFRYGGEEFVVLLPETGIAGVKRLAERVRRNVAALKCICDGQPIKMTASFGVTVLEPEDSEESFFVRADKALYRAKNEGRNCTRVSE